VLWFWIVLFPFPARAFDLWSDEEGERKISLDTALKASTLASRAPDDPVLFPERCSAIGLFRLRLGLSVVPAKWVNGEIAYEHRARLVTEDAGTGAGGGILPSEADAPYRLTQLDWKLAEHEDTFLYRHEVDRALIALHPAWGEVTMGRQAIGLGRGVLFGAVDVFAPFSPLEVDREWRRGVDGIRIEYRATDTSSVEFLGAFGTSWDDAALLGRARGYLGDVDGALIIGKRAEDIMYAGTLSGALFDAEIHLELALFRTRKDHPDGGLFGEDDLIGKAVLGGSYTFDVGDGLTVLAEYHYSGFGLEDVKDAAERFMDSDFRERYLRGDTQILGQHALAIQLSYPITDEWNSSLLVFQSPVDGSGLAAPSLHWDVAQNFSLIVSGYVPWGARPSRGQLRSEYGATPLGLFLQLNLYF
jgi:hypothetical protein